MSGYNNTTPDVLRMQMIPESQIPMSIFILCTNLAMGSMKYFLWIGFMFELLVWTNILPFIFFVI